MFLQPCTVISTRLAKYTANALCFCSFWYGVASDEASRTQYNDASTDWTRYLPSCYIDSVIIFYFQFFSVDLALFFLIFFRRTPKGFDGQSIQWMTLFVVVLYSIDPLLYAAVVLGRLPTAFFNRTGGRGLPTRKSCTVVAPLFSFFTYITQTNTQAASFFIERQQQKDTIKFEP